MPKTPKAIKKIWVDINQNTIYKGVKKLSGVSSKKNLSLTQERRNSIKKI